jgi:hypothetical protein
MGCRLLKMAGLTVVRASIGRKGVSGEWKALCRKPLAISRKLRAFSIVCVGVRMGVRASVAAAAEHEVAEVRQEAGFGWREEAIGYGDGEFGEDAADFVGGDHGAARGDEFAGEIGGAKSAVGGVSVGVAEAVALRMSGEGAAAPVGESKLASSICGFGVFRNHAGRIIYCVYSCLVTGSYMKFRMAAQSVRMTARPYAGGRNQ